MVFTGLTFALFENFWLLLFAAIIGVVSATGGDFGPFRSIEESMLSQLTTPGTRADVLAWYVTASAWGSSLGSEVGGRMIENLQRREGWGLKDAYHAVFWMYAGMGVVNIGVVLLLTRECEAERMGEGRKGYEEIVEEVEVEEEEDNDEESDEGSFTMVDDQQHQDRGSADEASSHSPGLVEVSVPTPTNPSARFDSLRSWILKWTGDISKPTLKVVWKLWVLLAIDSLADGMVPFSLTNYYMVSSQPYLPYLLPSNFHSTQKNHQKTTTNPSSPLPPNIQDLKFHPSKSTLGDVTSISYFLTALGGLFASPLAKKIGLVHTMVFTHIPSSTSVLLFPFPSTLWMTVALLFIRSALNNMDQAPRSALIAAIVHPRERTAVMGITSALRTLAATSGPMVTGFLAGSERFWVAFVVGGACRLVYDVGLWVLFVNVKLHQHEEERREEGGAGERVGLGDEEELLGGRRLKDGDDDGINERRK